MKFLQSQLWGLKSRKNNFDFAIDDLQNLFLGDELVDEEVGREAGAQVVLQDKMLELGSLYLNSGVTVEHL